MLQIARREAQRVLKGAFKPPRNAVITSVDPDTYSAKVRYEPHDANDPNNAESGWLPIQAMATGQGFGRFSVPKVGQPVEVDFQGGSHMTGTVKGRHASQNHQPPTGMKEGEDWLVHETGSVIKFLQDGTVFIGGAGTVPQRQGKDPATGQDGQDPQKQAQQPQAKQAFTLKPDGSFSFVHQNGSAVAFDTSGKITVSAKGQDVSIGGRDILHQAAQKIASQANKILLNCG